MYRAGVCSILSQLAREGRLSVIEDLTVDAPKTKLLSQKLKGMGLDSGVGDYRQPRRKSVVGVAQSA